MINYTYDKMYFNNTGAFLYYIQKLPFRYLPIIKRFQLPLEEKENKTRTCASNFYLDFFHAFFSALKKSKVTNKNICITQMFTNNIGDFLLSYKSYPLDIYQ